MAGLDDRLDQILARRDELQALLAEVQPSEYARLAKEFSELGPVVAAIEAYQAAKRELAEVEQLAADPEMRELAEQERQGLEARLRELEHQVRLMLQIVAAEQDVEAVSGGLAQTVGEVDGLRRPAGVDADGFSTSAQTGRVEHIQIAHVRPRHDRLAERADLEDRGLRRNQ